MSSEYAEELSLTVRNLRSHVLAELEYYDHRALQERRRAVVLRLIQIISVSALPPLIYMSTRGEMSWLSLSTLVLSGVTLITSTFQQLFQFDSRWMTYRLTREDLRRKLFEIELSDAERAMRPSGADDIEVIEKLKRSIRELEAKKESLWFAIEPTAEEVRKIRA